MWDFKPCRLYHCYKIEGNTAMIIGQDKLLKLRDAGKMLWEKANGRNTVSQIVDYIAEYYKTDEKDKIYEGVVTLMKKLKNKGLLIMNWDALYKDDLPQERS